MPTDATREDYPNDPVPLPADPGGAHTKGYSADPGPEVPVPADGPLPLADGPVGTIRHPEQEGGLPPTGRGQSGGCTSSEQVLGMDNS